MRMNEKERNRNLFYDTTGLKETAGIRKRCTKGYILPRLEARFPEDDLKVVSVRVNETGRYINRSKGLLGLLLPSHWIKGLPPYCEVQILHSTGRHQEQVTVWVPLAWNGRFLGTGGGGTSTGGTGYLVRPDNTSRGLSLPKAVMNGCAAATTDGGARKNQWGLDEAGKVDWELVENWRSRSTHTMTLLGKVVTEILHDCPVEFSYFHGGSGGGRQAMVEAQEYPGDYNGIWASCPAINWPRFLPLGLWANAVMNSCGHILAPEKIRYFMEAAQNRAGGRDAYYCSVKKVSLDPFSLVGQNTKKGPILKKDAEVMQKLWQGPYGDSGNRLWYYFRPGVQFWNVSVPVGSFYYSLFGRKPKPFFLSTYYMRWVTEQPKQRFDKVTIEEFQVLFDKSTTKFSKAMADKADLSAFVRAGGRLIIDHGMDDPLIPVDGTLDYYQKLLNSFGDKEQVDQFMRLYLTPGDGHGTCNWHGPGITERDGMKALIGWVEQGKAPGKIRTVQVDKKGNTIREGQQQAL